MIQRMVDGFWIDWISTEEGEYPEYNKKTKHAVRYMNAFLRSYRLKEKARILRDQACILEQKACEVMATVTKLKNTTMGTRLN